MIITLNVLKISGSGLILKPTIQVFIKVAQIAGYISFLAMRGYNYSLELANIAMLKI